MEIFFYFTLKSQRFDYQKSCFPAGTAASQRANSQTNSTFAPQMLRYCQVTVNRLFQRI